LPLAERLDHALEILGAEEEDLRTTRNQETLGLAGAIYKRKWEVDSQKPHLERSLAYYLRGYQEGPEFDNGYTGVNAAYLLDLLANLEAQEARQAGASSESAQARQELATEIRQKLVATLSAVLAQPGNEHLQNDWWLLVTLAEVHFGLKNYPEAGHWLQRAKALQPEPWQYETTACQLANLAHLHEQKAPPDELTTTAKQAVAASSSVTRAWDVLHAFLGADEAGLRAARVGKVGLALSGGGLRAALFHIGVLAKLAELDVLRSVEVLSCVSGGSIIGTYYYLAVRHLLQTKPDAEIKREDYIKLVQQIESDFLAGVQRNIRMRGSANLFANLKALLRRDCSRTEYIGELLESEIFARVKDGEGDRPRYLSGLDITPVNEQGQPLENFSPLRDNWRRAAKVPLLILNATTLNTGHNWQFTASWMGEPPTYLNPEFDTDTRLRRMYYWQAPGQRRRVRLGQAVAASVCLPGLFEPIVLTGLYPDMDVLLVDGGMCDTQGVAGLLDHDCTVLLVSSGHGQMETQNYPSGSVLEVPLRVNNILTTRARATQHSDLLARRRSHVARGLMYVHLQKDLDTAAVDWIGCDNPHEQAEDVRPASHRGVLTRYGIRKDVQAELAAIRSDLDSFHEVEAYALMTSGYRMTEFEFPRAVEGFPIPNQPRPDWRFLVIQEPLRRVGSLDRMVGLVKLLKVASKRGFKVWRLSRAMQSAGLLLSTAAIGLLAWGASRWWALPLSFTAGKLILAAAGVAALLTIGKCILVIRQSPKTLIEIGIELGIVLFGWLAAHLYLLILDPLYLRLGRVHTTLAFSKPADGFFSSIVQLIRALTETRGAEEIRTASKEVINTVKNIGLRLKQARPVQAVGQTMRQSDIGVSQFADHSLLVEVFSKAYETLGYQVFRFPRAKELNPLQLNLDLIARKQQRDVCMVVKTATAPQQTLTWENAIELETAALALKAGGLAPQSTSEPQNPASKEVEAVLALVDVEADQSLREFSAHRLVRLVPYTSQQIGRLLALTRLVQARSAVESESELRELEGLLENATVTLASAHS
jgi:predicted acylesterase/phospholipase RssA